MEEVMEEVTKESAAGQDDDLLLECDEESPETDEEEEEEEEGHDEALEAFSLMEEEETDAQAVRIIPIPVQPVSSCSSPKYNNTHDPAVKGSGVPLSFRLNGRLVPLLPGGAELKLFSHPGGSASGFTTVQIPVTLNVISPAGTHHATASPTTASPPTPETDPIPIITGVVSGEAAQRVLSSHSVNFRSSPPLSGLKTPPSAPDPPRVSPQKPAAASRRSKSRLAAPLKRLRKGQLGPVSPPGCLVCMSQYKLIMELRGFMCLCSPAIAKSLKDLRRKNHRRRSKDRNRWSRTSRETSSKGSKTRPGLPAAMSPPAHSVTQFKVLSPNQQSLRPPEDLQSDQFTSSVPPFTISSPQQDESQPPPDPPPGKMVIMVEDFYYGSAPGRSSIKPSTADLKFQCIHCPQMLDNNIKLMSHMQKHLWTMSQQDGHTDHQASCPHCFRFFFSPFKLQCHLEAAHSQYESTAKCKICELEFGSEPAFLWHMKTSHKPGEMPYVCQVCDFRSSFYSDVWSHFEKVHANTKYLLCQFCLRVLRSSTCYQEHFAKHQRRRVFSCDKCRLHFLFIKDRIEHNVQHHRTHIRPSQLSRLKPGTKVTVRTYSVAGGCDHENRLMAPCKVVDVGPPPPTEEAPKRKPVESLGPLLSSLSQESEEADVSRPSQRCVECLSLFQGFKSHFPSMVRCSLCRFITCCSTSYANHMISNHATCKKRPLYHSIFQSQPRSSQRLRCASCMFTTCKGDVMANHLTARPEHHCIMSTHSETENMQPTDDSCSDASAVSQGGGAFIPISLLPSGQTSTQLSVKALNSPFPLSSPSAMTIKFLGPRPQLDLCPVSPLSASQFEAVLFSLCHGLPQASRVYRTSPQTIRTWIQQQERHLSDRRWFWRTEKLAEWVLGQREQQLNVCEDVLLQTAKRVLGVDSQLMDWYSWTIDFLLRHDLSLQPINTDNNHYQRGKLPRNIRDNSRAFTNLLSVQIHKKASHVLASMDEFSIYIDRDQFSNQNPSALRLFGSSGEKPMFDVVLSALSDGTFLPPVLLFKGTPSHVPDGFPDNVLLAAQQDGITDQDCHRTWIKKVWQPHVASHSESLLIVDVHRGHLTDEFRSSLSAMSTNIFFIPSGCCCRLQPLDVCVTPVLRDFLQTRWTQLVSQGGLDDLGLDQLALTLGCWLSEVSSTLNSDTEILRRSFASVVSQQGVETQREAAKIIQALTEALVQPSQASEPSADPQPQLELLLVMEEKGVEQDKKRKVEQDKKRKVEQDKKRKVEQEEKEEEFLVRSPSALRQVFDGDSDQDSFHGFQDV